MMNTIPYHKAQIKTASKFHCIPVIPQGHQIATKAVKNTRKEDVYTLLVEM